jgi:ferritin-like protein
MKTRNKINKHFQLLVTQIKEFKSGSGFTKIEAKLGMMNQKNMAEQVDISGCIQMCNT